IVPARAAGRRPRERQPDPQHEGEREPDERPTAEEQLHARILARGRGACRALLAPGSRTDRGSTRGAARAWGEILAAISATRFSPGDPVEPAKTPFARGARGRASGGLTARWRPPA